MKIKTKKEPEKNKKIIIRLKKFYLPLILFIILLSLCFLTIQIILDDKYYPLTFIGDTNISFLTKGDSSRVLESKFKNRLKQNITFGETKTFTINLSSASATIDYSILDFVFANQHPANIFERIKEQFFALFKKYNVKPKIEIDIKNQINQIEKQVLKKAVNATLTYNELSSIESTPSANIQIQKSEDGIELDKEKLTDQIKNFLIFGRYNRNLPTKIQTPKVKTQDLEYAKSILLELQNQPLKINFDENNWLLDAKQLLIILDVTEGEDLLDKEKTYSYISKLASEIDQKVAEGQFEFNPDVKRVSIFKPSQEGRKLDEEQTFSLLNNALKNHIKEINLPVNIIKPKVETSQINNLGIKELIGRGISNFAGSMPNRIYNLSLTASRINGVLVAPSEIFSFNKTIGDISASTGFKQAYVIKEGRTVLDDGGGVCQDSTTLFRAVLNAGLPVVKRTAHAYRVGYYEQGFPPGLDATVFYPSVDFQFKNDTSAHILIQAYVIGNTLYFDLYGTSDGRIVNITKPVISNQTPAPPELRQDDLTLPKGVVKQVDWAAQGATVKFKRIVEKNGETIINETWTSNYKPWQAVYLVGTQ